MPRPQRRPPKFRITEGARKLRARLDRLKVSVPDFCDEHGLDRIQVQRALNGDFKRISVDFAWAIERATGGAIRVASWRQDDEQRGDRAA